MATKLKLDDLTRNEKLDREAMSQISGGGRTGQGFSPGVQQKRRFQDSGSKGWGARFHPRSR